MSIVTAASQFNFLNNTLPGATTAQHLNADELDRLTESVRALASVFTAGVNFRTAPTTPRWAFAYTEGTTAAKIVLDRMMFGALSRIGQYAQTLVLFGTCEDRDRNERVPNALATVDWLYSLAADVLAGEFTDNGQGTIDNTDAANAMVQRSMNAIAFDKRLGCSEAESKEIWRVIADELQGGVRGEVQIFPSNIESAEKALTNEAGRHGELLRHLNHLTAQQINLLNRSKRPEQVGIHEAKELFAWNEAELTRAASLGLNYLDRIKECTTDPIQEGLSDDEAAGDRRIEAALAEEFGGVFKTDDLHAGRTSPAMH